MVMVFAKERCHGFVAVPDKYKARSVSLWAQCRLFMIPSLWPSSVDIQCSNTAGLWGCSRAHHCCIRSFKSIEGTLPVHVQLSSPVETNFIKNMGPLWIKLLYQVTNRGGITLRIKLWCCVEVRCDLFLRRWALQYRRKRISHCPLFP